MSFLKGVKNIAVFSAVALSVHQAEASGVSRARQKIRAALNDVRKLLNPRNYKLAPVKTDEKFEYQKTGKTDREMKNENIDHNPEIEKQIQLDKIALNLIHITESLGFQRRYFKNLLMDSILRKQFFLILKTRTIIIII